MTTESPASLFKMGSQVRIRNSGFGPGVIVELRGPLGPNRAQVYRVQMGKGRHSISVEVLEEQLELVAS